MEGTGMQRQRHDGTQGCWPCRRNVASLHLPALPPSVRAPLRQAFHNNSSYRLMPTSHLFSIQSRKEGFFSNCPNEILELPYWLDAGDLPIPETIAVTRGGSAKIQECTWDKNGNAPSINRVMFSSGKKNYAGKNTRQLKGFKWWLRATADHLRETDKYWYNVFYVFLHYCNLMSRSKWSGQPRILGAI